MATQRQPQTGKRLSDELNERIDCEDLAERLGLQRPGGKGNFKSPHHTDKVPSVSVYTGQDGKSRFKDFGTAPAGAPTSGGPIDMLMWFKPGLDFVDALKELAEMYGIQRQQQRQAPDGGPPRPPAEETLAEFIARRCVDDAAAEGGRDSLVAYLEGRGISRAVIDQAIKRKTLGLNTYNGGQAKPGKEPKKPGEIGYGGPAAAFIIRHQLTQQALAVDMRYFDAELNGGVKTQSQGEKSGCPWTSDWRRVESARQVFVVESAINALSIETCNIPGTAAVAIRGTSNVETIDWAFLRGKQVVAALDNDEPKADGYCPGLKAAWRLHEILTGLDISCLLVDQADWFEDIEAREDPINDVNDYLQVHGVDALTKALAKLEPWMIPGMTGDYTQIKGKSRLYLPSHDSHSYWRYRVQPDYTRVVGKTTKDENGGPDKLEFQDVAGFRVAAVSRVQIASPTSTMTGDEDHSPRTVFALSVQTVRHGARLQRRVVDDERLHNLDVWNKLGPVYAPKAFSRLVNIWERAAGIGARDAINFVGLAWRDGRPAINEGPDCFFSDPRQQCPYSELTFPSGPVSHAAEVVDQFRTTFKDSAALIPLVWALGAHLKAFLGFWPHFVMQAEKGTGKTTLVKRIERAVAMSTMSRQSLQTEFRQLTSLSYTSHPVGWGEMSTNKQDIINKAISNLQEAYQYEHTRRGADLTDFLLCAPVLLSGEDVPVDSLVGKVVRSELTKARRGPLIPEDLPVFPVKQWLQFLTRQEKARVQQLQADMVRHLFENCIAATTDTGAERMVANYAGLATAWILLCEFMGQEPYNGTFLTDLTAEMNRHIKETASERQPWAWIVEKLLSEIAARRFIHPFKFDQVDEVDVLCVRTGYVMDYMRQTPYLREFWDGLPVKSDRVFKKQLASAGVLLLGQDGEPLSVEKTIKGQRVAHNVALSLPALKTFGLYATVPAETHEESHHGY